MNQMIKNALFVGAMFLPGTVGVSSTLVANSGCTAQEAKVVERDFLTVSQIACIAASALSDAPAIATACQIDAKLVPVIEPFLAAKRAGAFRCDRHDAGSDAAVSR